MWFGSELLFKLRFALFVHEKTPDAAQEAIDPFHTFSAPGLDHFERAQEHFVEAKGIGAEFPHHVVRVYDVAAGFRHLLAVFAKDQSLIDQLEERLGGGDIAEVVKHLMPEAAVEQVEHGVLGAADVEIDSGSRRAA